MPILNNCQSSHSQPPSGLRKLTAASLRSAAAAAAFDGLPAGVTTPGQLLAAFKAAAPTLRLTGQVVATVDWLFKWVNNPQDWSRGAHPIAWPSSKLQMRDFNLSKSRVKAVNRSLIEAGLVTMKDSPTGRRYGHRDKRTGLITEAYGFDLSPLAVRYAEFVRIAQVDRREHEIIDGLRRRVTIARKAITQVLEAARDHGVPGICWSDTHALTRDLVATSRTAETSDALTFIVARLERACEVAQSRLLDQFKAMETDPEGPVFEPHITSTNSAHTPVQDTVIAHNRERSQPPDFLARVSEPERRPISPSGFCQYPIQTTSRAGPGGVETKARESHLVRPSIAPRELMTLAPRLCPYLTTTSPGWPEMVDAADWLRQELHISQAAWAAACVAMGRERAALSVAIISARPQTHFRSSPGAYLLGMIRKANTGRLDLARTIWGLRQTLPKRPRESQATSARSSSDNPSLGCV